VLKGNRGNRVHRVSETDRGNRVHLSGEWWWGEGKGKPLSVFMERGLGVGGDQVSTQFWQKTSPPSMHSQPVP